MRTVAETAPRFRLLGELEVEGVDRPALGGPKQRGLLAVLLLHANELVARDRLIDAVWGELPPPSAPAIVHGYIRKLRAALATTGARILTRSPGYVLELDDDDLDVRRFERLAGEGREALAAGDDAHARTVLEKALALWRGTAIADLVYEPSAEAEARRLDALRLEATMDRIDADLALGANGALAGELEALVARHPLVERLRSQLMVAQYRAGRQGDALETLQSIRTALANELGLEPGPRLRELERRILQQDPALMNGPKAALRRRRAHGARAAVAAAFAAAFAAVALVVVFVVGAVGEADKAGTSSSHGDRLLAIAADSGRIVQAAELTGTPAALAVGLGSIWVANPSREEVARADAASGSQTDRIPVRGQPAAVTTTNGAVWVAGALGGWISRVDPETGSVTQTIRLPGAHVSDIATDGQMIWAASSTDHKLVEIDPETGAVRRRIVVDLVPTAVAAGDGAVWVAGFDAGVVEAIDARSGRVLVTVTVGQGPSAIAVAPDAVWVANRLDATVSRIDPRTGSVRATIAVPSGPEALAALPSSVWVASADAGVVTEVDPRRNRIGSSVRVGGRPQAIAATRDRVWVAAAPPADQHRGGTLTLVRSGRFDTTDPALFFASSTQFTRLAYDTLVTFQAAPGRAGLRLVPDLALALPRPVEGGTTYRFRLRAGIRYSNGTLLRAHDFRRAIERLFRLRSPGASYYAGLVGAPACERRPAGCDLHEGIQTDEVSRTVVFRLRAPDPDFLYKLAVLAYATPIPPGVPNRDVGFHPIPGTGPYRFGAIGRDGLRFQRNPFFHEWSHAAQPAGNPDTIVWRYERSLAAAIDDVAHGRADWVLGLIPPERLRALRLRYASRVHANPSSIVDFIPLNTHLPPFDDVRVRRAFNYAIDRLKIARWYGGDRVAAPLCQPLAPGLPGYRRYCPYTRRPQPDGRWRGPDLARARRLVAASGTRGERVDVWATRESGGVPDEVPRYVASLLRRLGYRVRLHLVRPARITLGMRRTLQLSVDGDWLPDYPAPSSYLPSFFGCHGGTSNGYVCDPAVDRRMRTASTLQLSDPQRASALWAAIDRQLVDAAYWVPTVSVHAPEFVSARVRNYQLSPVGGFIAHEAWVR